MINNPTRAMVVNTCREGGIIIIIIIIRNNNESFVFRAVTQNAELLRHQLHFHFLLQI